MPSVGDAAGSAGTAPVVRHLLARPVNVCIGLICEVTLEAIRKNSVRVFCVLFYLALQQILSLSSPAYCAEAIMVD